MRKLMGGVMSGVPRRSVVALVLIVFPTRVTGESQCLVRRTESPTMNGIWQTLGTANWDLEDHSGRSPAACPVRRRRRRSGRPKRR